MKKNKATIVVCQLNKDNEGEMPVDLVFCDDYKHCFQLLRFKFKQKNILYPTMVKIINDGNGRVYVIETITKGKEPEYALK